MNCVCIHFCNTSGEKNNGYYSFKIQNTIVFFLNQTISTSGEPLLYISSDISFYTLQMYILTCLVRILLVCLPFSFFLCMIYEQIDKYDAEFRNEI